VIPALGLLIPDKLKRIAIVAGLVVFVAMASGTLGFCKGQSSERAVWQARVERVEREYAEKARAADANRTQQINQADADIRRNREELDRETANLPDESPSARRRARVCRELRDDARRRRVAAPAC
jgi:hypothetical protein